jgi:hypothetical protein
MNLLPWHQLRLMPRPHPKALLVASSVLEL